MNRRYSIGISIFAAVGGAWLAMREFDRRSGIQSVLAWARLSPIPSAARGLELTASGGMFTRGYTLVFYVDAEEAAAWLASSPGMVGATATENGSVTTYDIEPGGGAVHAELRIDHNLGKVTVYAHWS